MNKTQLIDVIQKELGPEATKQAAADALNATLAAIIKSVAKEKVQLVGFGSFETKNRPARKGRNPRTGETMEIPASSTVTFKPSSSIKG
ncbi:MAG: HU family DNA-binding protein [Akkermansia sp.]|nr:HU family DNA-binding protein [Akkermansia sp.]